MNFSGKKELQEIFEAVLRTSKQLEDSYDTLKIKFNILENKLENNRRYLENILQSINTGVCSVDMDHKITTFNKEASKIFNIDEVDAKNKYIYELFQSDTFKEDIFVLVKVFKEEKILDINVGGVEKKINLSISQIKDLDDVIGCVFIFSDITKLEKLKEENIKKEKLATIGKMATTIAHDIKNPLASMELLLPLLLENINDDSKRNLANNILISMKRIDNIVNNTLLFAKSATYRPSTFGIKVLMSEIECEIYASLISKHIEFDKNYEDLVITTDRNLLKRALINLTINAIDAARNRVFVSAFKNNESFMFEVIDDGSGIPNDILTHLFEPFYTNKKNGTGLGLSIVKQAVELINGKLNFETSSNGTKFLVKI